MKYINENPTFESFVKSISYKTDRNAVQRASGLRALLNQ